MKRVGIVCFYLLFVLGIFAQKSNEQTKKEINKIKISRSYLCAEATMPTLKEAEELAYELLINEINQWLSEQKKQIQTKQIVLQDIKSCTESLEMERGINIRAFIYIKKKDIIPIYGNGLVLTKEEEGMDNDSPTSEVAAQPDSVEAESDTPPSETEQPITAVDPMQRIIAATNMDDIKLIFNELKQQNKIEYGKYTSLDQNISDTCLLLYNREGKIVAVLDKGDNSRMNLQTKQPDKMTNYNGNAIYWFIIK